VKKKTFIIFIKVGVITFIFFSILFFIFGTPWGKATAVKEAQEYLDNTYKQKMVVVLYTTYNFEQKVYIAHANPINNKNIKFNVYISRDGSIWYDSYYIENFSYELGKGINRLTKDLFGNKNRAYANIYSDYIKGFDIENLNENTQITEVEKYFNNQYYINVIVDQKFDSPNREENVEKMFKLINYINNLNSKPDRISISFCYGENGLYTNFKLELDREEYQKIHSISDLKNYIEDNIKK